MGGQYRTSGRAARFCGNWYVNFGADLGKCAGCYGDSPVHYHNHHCSYYYYHHRSDHHHNSAVYHHDGPDHYYRPHHHHEHAHKPDVAT